MHVLTFMRFLVATVIVLAACSRPKPLVHHPRGYAARMTDADVHSERAREHRRAAREAARTPLTERYNCGDVALSDQATSGGERLVPVVPCWDIAEEAAAHERYLAAREQRRADRERRAATSLVEAELAACRGLPARELEHSPFAHRKAIAEVIPHRETGTIRGVRIVFKPVPGLTAAWMRQAIACHRARFERLGEPATYFPGDPALVAGATATVEMRNGHLEITIASTDDTSARVALERARDLVAPLTARR